MALRLQSLFGLFVFVFLAFLIGRMRGSKTIPWRVILWGIALQFIFGAEGVPGAGPLTWGDREVANRMRGYWINFAKTGNPNGPDLPHWDAAADRDRLLLITNDRIASGDDPWSDRLDRLASESRK